MTKFSGSVATVRNLAASGTIADDELQRALQLYQNSHPKKKPFKFVHCWRVLSTEPKWQDYRARPNKKRSDTSAASDEPSGGTDEGTEKRPPGVKASKEAAQSSANVEHSVQRMAAANAKIAANGRKRLRLLQEANNHHLLSVELSTLDDDAREYYALQRAAVLAKIHRRAAAPVATVGTVESDVDSEASAQADEEESEAASDVSVIQDDGDAEHERAIDEFVATL